MPDIEIIDLKKQEAKSVAALVRAAYKVGKKADKLGFELPPALPISFYSAIEPVLLAITARASDPSALMAPSKVPVHLAAVFAEYTAAYPRAATLKNALAAYAKAFEAASPKARTKAFTKIRDSAFHSYRLAKFHSTPLVLGLAAAERLVRRERAIFSNMALARNPKAKHADVEMTDEGMSDFDYLVSAANDLDHAMEMAYEADQANEDDEDKAVIEQHPMLVDEHYIEVRSDKPLQDHEAFDAAVKQYDVKGLGLDLTHNGIRFMGVQGVVRFVDWDDMPPRGPSALPGSAGLLA